MANVPYRDAVILCDLANLFRKLLATFFVEGRDREANDLAVVRRREPEIRADDGLLHRTELRDVPRLYGYQLRLRDGD